MQAAILAHPRLDGVASEYRVFRTDAFLKAPAHLSEVGGAGTLEQAIKAARGGGTVSPIGVRSGARPLLNRALLAIRKRRLQGVTVGCVEMMDASRACIGARAFHRLPISRRGPREAPLRIAARLPTRPVRPMADALPFSALKDLSCHTHCSATNTRTIRD